MAEYIEREALLCMVQPDDPSDEKAAITIATAKKLIRNIVSRTPASDVEPVVRCRECKHHCWVQEPCHGKRVHYCKIPHMRGIEIFKEFFCYYGERKEGADND